MNILYHHRTTATGACGHHIREMVEAFRKQGHTVDVVGPPGTGKAHAAAAGSQKKGRYAVPQPVFELFELLYNAVAFFRLLRRLRQKRYDLLYERYAIFNLAGVCVSRLLRVPVVLEASFTATTPVYPERTGLLSPLAALADRFVFNAADLIVTVSGALKENIMHYGVAADRILVLPNAVDAVRFDPAAVSAVPRDRGEKIVGFAGGFYPWHGLDLLIAAAGEAAKTIPGLKIWLIGDGPVREKLEAAVLRRGLTERVRFMGSVPQSELPRYVAAFDAGIMPDSNDYGSPMKIFEYMAMGKPVIAPRLGPIEEVLTDGETGVLFEPKDTGSMSAAIVRLLENPSLCGAIAARARGQVLERHTWDGHARAVTGYLETIIGGKNAASGAELQDRRDRASAGTCARR